MIASVGVRCRLSQRPALRRVPSGRACTASPRRSRRGSSVAARLGVGLGARPEDGMGLAGEWPGLRPDWDEVALRRLDIGEYLSERLALDGAVDCDALPENESLFFLITPRPPRSTLFPYTTLFR